MNNDIITLQELVAHQSQQIAELSDEVHAQQSELVRLSRLVEQMRKKLMTVDDGQGIRKPDEETPPPHY